MNRRQSLGGGARRNFPLKGFTLAEVLITLGVIGVVAALTLPTVMSNYRKSVVETRIAKFYTIANQAVKLSEVENGPMKYWETPNDITTDDGPNINGSTTVVSSSNMLEWYNKYLAKYLKTVKIEETNDYEGKLALYFPDGSLALISTSSWLFYPNAKDLNVALNSQDLADRDRTVSGTKYFTFYFYSELGTGVQPLQYQYSYTDEQLRTLPDIGCTTQMPTNERALCALLIARNGWKIPKDYPLKF